MSKINIQSISSLTNEQSALTALANNESEIETKSDTFLSRDGSTPNHMLANLDMNSFRITNLPEPVDDSEPVRLVDLDSFAGGITGEQGPPGAAGANGTNGADGSVIIVQNSAPSTTQPTGSVWLDADSTDADLYQISAGSWTDTGVNLRGPAGTSGTGSGDVSSGSTFANDNRLVRTDTPTGNKNVQQSGITVDDSNNVSGVGTLASDTQTITSTSASALAVGRQGATDPVLKVNANTASVATGLSITGAAATGRVAVATISSGADEGLSIDAKGSGTIRLGATSTGAVEFSRNAIPTSSDGAALGDASHQWSDLLVAPGAVINFGGGDTNLTHTNTEGLALTSTRNLTLGNTSLHLLDTDASHDLIVKPGTNLTADRTLTITTPDADRTLNVTDPTFTTIELGTAGTTDTTIARSGAGTVTIEGVEIARNSTGQAHTASQYEVGAASDTTLARSAAGQLSVEGFNLGPAITINSQSAAYSIVSTDANCCIYHPSTDNNARTFTIPANGSVAFPVGTTLTFVNEINTVTIAITTDTLTLAGTGTTGSRTLAANGVATALKVAATKWIISGNGLT